MKINNEKTRRANLGKGESLDFLGFTFSFKRSKYGAKSHYLTIEPSQKSQKKIRERIKEKTSPSKCNQPITKVVEDLNSLLRGWGNYFGIGHPRKSFHKLNNYVLIRELKVEKRVYCVPSVSITNLWK